MKNLEVYLIFSFVGVVLLVFIFVVYSMYCLMVDTVFTFCCAVVSSVVWLYWECVVCMLVTRFYIMITFLQVPNDDWMTSNGDCETTE